MGRPYRRCGTPLCTLSGFWVSQVVCVTTVYELNLVQCGGATLALVMHATVIGACRYAALGSVCCLLVLSRVFLRVPLFQRSSHQPVLS